jgi:hypothetical protein
MISADQRKSFATAIKGTKLDGPPAERTCLSTLSPGPVRVTAVPQSLADPVIVIVLD